MKTINVLIVKNVAFKMAKELMEYNESIPDFHTRFPNILESCVRTPFQKFDNKSLYGTLLDKASILLFLMIKNHPFQNGNKRIALCTLLIFLFLNKKWLKVDQIKMYKFIVSVAESRSEDKESTVQKIKEFIKKNLVDLGPGRPPIL